MQRTAVVYLAFMAFLLVPAYAIDAQQDKLPSIPDFTKGDTIPANAKHDWNLGPTGLRGWMFFDKMVTTDARQFSLQRSIRDHRAMG